MLLKLRAFFAREPVLCIAGGAALATAFAVPPTRADYLAYLDLRVLALLFCLMAVVGGLQQAGLFSLLAQRTILRAHSVRGLCTALVLLCFFSSMLVTNDVALLTFVPFAALVLGGAGLSRHLLLVVVLQTVAANLGSMLTPVGNPQNLYLYSYYQMGMGDFLAAVLPVAALSLALLLVLLLCIPRAPLSISQPKPPALPPRPLACYGLLFLLCLLTVLHLLPYPLTLAAVLAYTLLRDRPVLRRVDYGLLLTFVFFFVFVGNLGQIEPVRRWLHTALAGREFLAAAGCSQVISNVPAAVLLSGFTAQGKALLLGTNIGGLGTLVASLASLIAFRLYARTEGARTGRYMALFTAVNLALLVVLLPLGLYLCK